MFFLQRTNLSLRFSLDYEWWTINYFLDIFYSRISKVTYQSPSFYMVHHHYSYSVIIIILLTRLKPTTIPQWLFILRTSEIIRPLDPPSSKKKTAKTANKRIHKTVFPKEEPPLSQQVSNERPARQSPRERGKHRKNFRHLMAGDCCRLISARHLSLVRASSHI